MKKILIIEDNEKIADIERDYLQANGYKVDISKDGLDGIEKVKVNKYDLIILDIMLPNIDGFETFDEISKYTDIPVIFVTAKNESLDKLKGLGLGATDYIVKPFEPLELIARVSTHIRRYELLTKDRNEKIDESKIIVDDMIIEEKSRRVYIRNQEIILPNKEFDLLLFLARNPNVVFSKQELLDMVWGVDSFVGESTVAVHINRIRDKIEKDSLNPKYIQTIWGAGYRFII